MPTPISTLMTRPVRTVDMDDTVAQVEATLAQYGLTWVPVVHGGRAVMGVISASDVLQFRAQGRDPNAVRAWQLCTYKPVQVDQDTPLAQVARQMVEQRIHHVVVPQAAGLAGVVSSLDFVRAFVEPD